MITLAATVHIRAPASTGRCAALLHTRSPTAASAPVAPPPVATRRFLARRSRTFLHRPAIGARHEHRVCRTRRAFLWRSACWFGARDRHRHGPRPNARAFAIDREPHAHAGALADAAGDVEIDAVQPHQSFDDRQSETGAAMPAIVRCARLEIRLADAGEVLLVDSD